MARAAGLHVYYIYGNGTHRGTGYLAADTPTYTTRPPRGVHTKSRLTIDIYMYSFAVPHGKLLFHSTAQMNRPAHCHTLRGKRNHAFISDRPKDIYFPPVF